MTVRCALTGRLRQRRPAPRPCSPCAGAFGTPRAWNAQSGPLRDEGQQACLARGLSSPRLSGLGEGVD